MEKSHPHTIVSLVQNLIDQDRVTSFSDSVFAFAATLLVIKIDLPTVVESQISTQFFPAFAALWPQYLANIITFVIIGFYWLNHHAIFALIKRVNPTLVWFNMIFLIFLSFLPFPVDLYGDHYKVPIVVAFYCASLALVGFLLAAVWIYAVNAMLINQELSKKVTRLYTVQYLTAPIIFVLSVPLAFIHPLIAQFSWVFIVVSLCIIGAIYKSKKPNEIERLAAD